MNRRKLGFDACRG